MVLLNRLSSNELTFAISQLKFASKSISLKLHVSRHESANFDLFLTKISKNYILGPGVRKRARLMEPMETMVLNYFGVFVFEVFVLRHLGKRSLLHVLV